MEHNLLRSLGLATALRIVAFGGLVIAGFIWIATYLTGVSGGADYTAAIGDVSAEAGEAVFFGPGQCATCHSVGAVGSAVRGPNLGVLAGQFDEPIAVRAATRKPGVGAIDYLVESLYEPGAFVTPGFPDGVMTPVHRPPIALADEQIRAVVLYLLAASGVDAGAAQVAAIERAQRRYHRAGAAVADVAPGIRFPKGSARAGKQAFEHFECRLCHVVRGIEWSKPLAGGIGPELTGVGAVQTESYLFESIVNPNAVVLPDPSPDKPYSENGKSKMPEWGYVMTVQQAIDIAAFLKTLTEPPPAEPEVTP